MVPEFTLLGASLALGVSFGLLAHEGTHAVALHLSGVPYRVKILPHRDGHPIRWLTRTPWAVVLPAPRPATPTWALQLGALAPLLLAVPLFTLAALGHTPTAASPVQLSFALGWFACALPSPQDFSVAFYADRALESVALDGTESGTGTHR